MDWNSCLQTIAATSDKQLFMQFYDHFAPRLNSWLQKLCGNRSLAEELTQEAMLQVWRKAALFDPSKASASTWLFRIGRNLYIDNQRRQAVRDKAQPILQDQATAQQENNDLIEPNFDQAKLKQAIADLPQRQAQVIYQSYFQGLSHQEIATRLDLPLGSVKSSLRLGFQKLTKAMRSQS